MEEELGQVVLVQKNRRNPLSLDMGWKRTIEPSISSALKSRNPLSLDMGWKSDINNPIGVTPEGSQSAFAGYGLEEFSVVRISRTVDRRNPLSLDMGWKRNKSFQNMKKSICRNPLSLDMGWKRPWSLEIRFILIRRNPLSLDMGWKSSAKFLSPYA